MDYYQYQLITSSETAELLPALLADLAFDTFEETATGMAAYMPADAEHAQQAEEALEELRERFALTWQRTLIPGQNWNVLWESNFQPVIVEEFCGVRAHFHEPLEGVQHELIIHPKMAFGTGHHETTWQCMRALRDLPLQGAHLLDYGCGTGILAILAARLGAATVEAIDIEEESYQNTMENASINHTPQVVARCGILKDVRGSHFDGILANINRNVILESLPRLSALLRPDGWLLVSGILEQDAEGVTQAATATGFTEKRRTQKGNWMCILYGKSPL